MIRVPPRMGKPGNRPRRLLTLVAPQGRQGSLRRRAIHPPPRRVVSPARRAIPQIVKPPRQEQQQARLAVKIHRLQASLGTPRANPVRRLGIPAKREIGTGSQELRRVLQTRQRPAIRVATRLPGNRGANLMLTPVSKV